MPQVISIKTFFYVFTLVLPANIKSMNSMQRYPHIIELFACILNMFAFMLLFPINLLISLGTCSTPKLL